MSVTPTAAATANPALAAAAPSLVAALQAIQTFFATIGTDPAQWPVKIVPAQTILLGQLGLQIPALTQAEVGAGFTAADNVISGWITKLKAV
jgi:hypothetical protein